MSSTGDTSLAEILSSTDLDPVALQSVITNLEAQENDVKARLAIARRLESAGEMEPFDSKELEATALRVQQQLNANQDSIISLKPLMVMAQSAVARISYVNWLQLISSTGTSLVVLTETDLHAACKQYALLVDMQLILSATQCSHLARYLNDWINHSYELLKPLVLGKLTTALAEVKYPFSDEKPMTGVDTTHLAETASLAARLSIPLSHADNTPLSITLPSFIVVTVPPISLITQHLCQPLYQRFKYHFYGDVSTNRLDKPEWYLSLVQSWISNHISVIDDVLQPAVAEYAEIDLAVEFTTTLVLILLEKLALDVPEILYDDDLFAHLVDELLRFTNRLPSLSQLDVVAVLCQEEPLNRWLSIESASALQKLDTLLSGRDATAGEDPRYPEFAEAATDVIPALLRRAEAVEARGLSGRFVQLTIELLENLRVRLRQLASQYPPLSTEKARFTNGMQHICRTLAQWQLLPILVNSALPLTDFEHTLNELRHERVAACISDCRERLSVYATNPIWLATTKAEQAVSAQAYDLLLAVRDHLAEAEQHLSLPVFRKFWPLFAQDLDSLIYSNVLTVAHFTELGATQLSSELHKFLFPLFSAHCGRPVAFFPKVDAGLRVISHGVGSLLLIRESLRSGDSTAARVVLEELDPNRALSRIAVEGVAGVSPSKSAREVEVERGLEQLRVLVAARIDLRM